MRGGCDVRLFELDKAIGSRSDLNVETGDKYEHGINVIRLNHI